MDPHQTQPAAGATPEDILTFWFVQLLPRQWFARDPDLDQQVRERFEGATEAALTGALAGWGKAPAPALALVLLLDQFPRQIWRDTARAFAGDPQALALSLQAEAEGWIAAESDEQRRAFWLMPRMHSEDLAVQEAALPLFACFTDSRTADFALRHRDVIARFGRFPHRNQILGRESSPEEQAFLLTPGSRF